MREENAQQLLDRVMGWDAVRLESEIRYLSQVARFKYDGYQRFFPGRRFIESLALWLNRFEKRHREAAYRFVRNRLIYISDSEITHLVQMAYPDVMVSRIYEQVAKQIGAEDYQVGKIRASQAYLRSTQRSLFLGLSDGARTHELRRYNPEDIRNDQIYHAYDLSDEKIERMLKDHREACRDPDLLFETLWLLDDFSASGRTYIRKEGRSYSGKIPRFLLELNKNKRLQKILNLERLSVHVILYVATRMAVNNIAMLSAKFCAAKKILATPRVSAVLLLEDRVSIDSKNAEDVEFLELVQYATYYDPKAETDSNIGVGGTDNVRLGFFNCALPLVLNHNTPNNSVYLLWGPDDTAFPGLFPRIDRHR